MSLQRMKQPYGRFYEHEQRGEVYQIMLDRATGAVKEHTTREASPLPDNLGKAIMQEIGAVISTIVLVELVAVHRDHHRMLQRWRLLERQVRRGRQVIP